MRAYHHFSLNREAKHLIIGFLIILTPLFGLITFSFVSGIDFRTVLFDLGVSAWRLFVAFLIAMVLAWGLVVSLVRGKTGSTTLAAFDVLQSVPTFALLPVAVHIWGPSTWTIIFFLTITVIWPIIFSIVSALKQVERSRTEAVIVSRIRGLDYIRYYLLPLTAPGIVTGAIIGLGEGWEALIGTEIILNAPHGLGAFFQSFSSSSSMTLFGVLVFLTIIYAINKFIWLPLLEKSHELVEE
ncbi:MAG TPA: ABC transporter permease subunit [Candidatus Paceibacterota bacterium]|jgi:ABC-type nitrate/sulfonate/bicarbonate transport system permease component|nr:ABC transporter permease subunit [Candidatus Paceibacterota bacterium]